MAGRSVVTGPLGALASLGPESVRRAVGLVTEGLVIDLSIPMDAALLPAGDPAFNRPFRREDVMTPAQWRDRVPSGTRAFHLDAFGGSIHQGTHLDGLAHIVEDGRIWGGHAEAEARSGAGWSVAGVETVPPIVARGILLDVAAVRGAPVPGSEEIGADELRRVAERTGATIRPGDAVLVRTGKIRELDGARDRFLERQPGIGAEGAAALADQGMVLYGSDTGGTEPQPVLDWDRTVHVELLIRRGIHLLEWLDLDELGSHLAGRGRTDFLLVVTPLRITGATGSWVRPIAIL